MPGPVIAKLASVLAMITVNIQDKENGHLRVSVFGIPFHDSERQERRFKRKLERRRRAKEVEQGK